MSQNQSDCLCHSCQANWTNGEWSADCRECGGGALERDCTFCNGRCGGKSQRAIMDSHDYARAHWIGACLLSKEEQDKIREQRLLDYEQERQKNKKHNSGMMQRLGSDNTAKGFMAVLAFVGVGLLKNSDNLWRFVRKSFGHEVVEQTIVPIGSRIAAREAFDAFKDKDKKKVQLMPFSDFDTFQATKASFLEWLIYL